MKTPLISVIVPSYNQAQFLEATLLSILEQKEGLAEILVMDGGSTDGSVAIIKKYADRIAYWQSCKDGGQAAALQAGLARAKGEFIGWQNSDDKYLPGVFEQFEHELAGNNGEGDVYFGHCDVIDCDDRVIRKRYFTRFSPGAFFYSGWNITNQSAFFRRSKLTQLGGFNSSFQYAMDGDLVYRLIRGDCRFVYVNSFWGQFRIHADAKGSTMQAVARKEWALLHAREHSDYDVKKEWKDQWKFRRLAYLARRHVLLLLDGNWLAWWRMRRNGAAEA